MVKHHYFTDALSYSVMSNISKPSSGKSLYYITIDRDFSPALNAIFVWTPNLLSMTPFMFNTLANGGTAPGSKPNYWCNYYFVNIFDFLPTNSIFLTLFQLTFLFALYNSIIISDVFPLTNIVFEPHSSGVFLICDD